MTDDLAMVTAPASSGLPVQTITLADADEDGVYLGTVATRTGAAGSYTFDVTATGNSNADPPAPCSLRAQAAVTVGAFRTLVPILMH